MSNGPVTQLLRRMDGESGETRQQTFAELVILVQAELKQLARGRLRGERNDSLQPTMLVTAVWERLQANRMRFEDRQHFLAVAATAMRRHLVDVARRERAEKRGGKRVATTLDDGASVALAVDPALVIDVDRAIATLSPREALLVELRFFVGFTMEEIAAHQEVSLDTVKADWRLARAKLQKELDSWGTGGSDSSAAS